jgi:hypothetical protein
MYKGAWGDDKRQGFGIFLYANGARFEGFWHDDKMHGEGVLMQEDRAIHEGKWEAGIRTTNLFKYANGLVGVRNKEDNNVVPWAKNPDLPKQGEVE